MDISQEQINELSLGWWEERLTRLGIVRNRDRIVGDQDPSKLSLDLGGKFFQYDKASLYECIKSAEFLMHHSGAL